VALRAGVLLVLAGALGCRPGTSASHDTDGRPFDVLLRNGWLVDGTGNPRWKGDLAIRGDRIAAMGRLGGAAARETLDVTGLVVAPGFIDMMGQSEINVLIDNRVLSKVTQGITTEVTGEGGSVAPLTDALVALDSDAMRKYHYREDWRDLDGYFAQLARNGSTVNIATFVGATQVRLAVVGSENRAPTGPELAHMVALVDTMMEQGALGLWSALEYAPASYSSTEELIALARAARRHGGIYASHMRNEGSQIDQALDELFRIAREADIPAEVSHLKVAGRRSWGHMPAVLARIDSARAAGLDVTADQYPYVAAATSLDASVPTWAESGGLDSLMIRLRDPAIRQRLHREILRPPDGTEGFYNEAGGGGGILITGVFQDSLRTLQGKRISEIAALRHRDPIETVFDILLAEGGHRTDAVYFVMSEPDVQAAMRTGWVAVNTDFGGVAPNGPLAAQSAHPRAYGTFPRILGRYVRDLHLMPLEFAVRKMTSLAAQRVGLRERGLLRPGMFADITVFDPRTVADRATFDDPHQVAVGIEDVFVNGEPVLVHGRLMTARPGRGLRGPGYVPAAQRGKSTPP
jgi:N-acyl-D-amino-acid deacylase